MAKRWTVSEEDLKYLELKKLYITENKTIGEIAKLLGLGQSTVYDRLKRLGIKSIRSEKIRFNNKRTDILIPVKYSGVLAEFVGIMLGDGHLNKNQVIVTLGNKEKEYVKYVAKLIKKVFFVRPKVIDVKGYSVIYFGSVDVVRWLLSMGLVFNKVKSQVGVPHWIFSNKKYIHSFLRGFFDTDGSVYRLKFGIQMAYTNRSIPLLWGAREGLSLIDLNPSKISNFRIYLTRKRDISTFFDKIRPANEKHVKRYNMFCIR